LCSSLCNNFTKKKPENPHKITKKSRKSQKITKNLKNHKKSRKSQKNLEKHENLENQIKSRVPAKKSQRVETPRRNEQNEMCIDRNGMRNDRNACGAC
jgi:hypothetical protein